MPQKAEIRSRVGQITTKADDIFVIEAVYHLRKALCAVLNTQRSEQRGCAPQILIIEMT